MDSIEKLQSFLHNTLDETNFQGLGTRYVGKVRDVYSQEHRSILITTDRQSAFDISWCSIPLKGQVLNQLSAWWFRRVEDIMPTQVIALPDENAMVVRRLKMLPIEIVVRAYLAGSTNTSAWVNYSQGMRNIAGNLLPEGLRKNEQLSSGVILTPTTKDEHDELIDPAQIVERGLASEGEWEEVSEMALRLFQRGQEIAAQRGLILVDTKYEMGYDEEGRLCIGDEVHTPDSSRYWIASSYEERFARGLEPESLDKEFFRLWLRDQGFEYGGEKPAIIDEVRLMLAQKYIRLYEKITGEAFQFPAERPVLERIEENVKAFL